MRRRRAGAAESMPSPFFGGFPRIRCLVEWRTRWPPAAGATPATPGPSPVEHASRWSHGARLRAALLSHALLLMGSKKDTALPSGPRAAFGVGTTAHRIRPSPSCHVSLCRHTRRSECKAAHNRTRTDRTRRRGQKRRPTSSPARSTTCCSRHGHPPFWIGSRCPRSAIWSTSRARSWRRPGEAVDDTRSTKSSGRWLVSTSDYWSPRKMSSVQTGGNVAASHHRTSMRVPQPFPSSTSRTTPSKSFGRTGSERWACWSSDHSRS